MDGGYPITTNQKEIKKTEIELDKFIEECVHLLSEVRQKNPLIHVIPNMVSASFVADAISCVGARPFMAMAEEEIAEVVSHSNALVVNMGQPNDDKVKAVLLALHTANRCQIPIVLDPVGAGASNYRSNTMTKILGLSWEGIIKGNPYEIENIQKKILQHQGVDAKGNVEIAVPLSSQRIYAITGQVDYVWTNTHQYQMKHLTEDIPYKIVGTGCVAAGLCGVFHAVTKKREVAAVTALALLSLAQESARNVGYGTYKISILDKLSRIPTEELKAYLKEVLDIQIGGK
jgi:hydroxyethylthiazole kinase